MSKTLEITWIYNQDTLKYSITVQDAQELISNHGIIFKRYIMFIIAQVFHLFRLIN